MVEANREQIEHWNANAGPAWAALQEQLDRGIRAHGLLALDALALAAGERVLDVGCGCGDTTLEAARRVGPRGEVLGVDVSAPMLARAEQRARELGLGSARLLRADAQTAELGAGRFDAMVSRFGVMFFDDPAAAFRNLARALRPGGRAAFVCWQTPERNPWVAVPMAAAAPFVALPPPPPAGAPGMFSLADGARLRALLEGAGFRELAIEDRRLPMTMGSGALDEVVEIFLQVGPVAGALREAGASEAQRAAAATAVREAYARHVMDGRVTLDSALWLVSAHVPR